MPIGRSKKINSKCYVKKCVKYVGKTEEKFLCELGINLIDCGRQFLYSERDQPKLKIHNTQFTQCPLGTGTTYREFKIPPLLYLLWYNKTY